MISLDFKGFLWISLKKAQRKGELLGFPQIIRLNIDVFYLI